MGNANESIGGKLQKAGNIHIFVPEGYTCKTGTNLGEPDDNQIWLQTVPPTITDYVWVIVQENEEALDLNISMSKSINQARDLEPFMIDDTSWGGITYDYGELVCNVLKGKNGKAMFQVTVIGHTVDSDLAQKVLGSIVL